MIHFLINEKKSLPGIFCGRRRNGKVQSVIWADLNRSFHIWWRTGFFHDSAASGGQRIRHNGGQFITLVVQWHKWGYLLHCLCMQACHTFQIISLSKISGRCRDVPFRSSFSHRMETKLNNLLQIFGFCLSSVGPSSDSNPIPLSMKSYEFHCLQFFILCLWCSYWSRLILYHKIPTSLSNWPCSCLLQNKLKIMWLSCHENWHFGLLSNQFWAQG